MTTVGAIGHALAAATYLALALVLLAGWRGREVGLRLIIAVTATALWGATVAVSERFGAVTPAWMVVAEQFRLGAWLYALAGLAASASLVGWLRRAAIIAAAAAIG